MPLCAASANVTLARRVEGAVATSVPVSFPVGPRSPRARARSPRPRTAARDDAEHERCPGRALLTGRIAGSVTSSPSEHHRDERVDDARADPRLPGSSAAVSRAASTMPTIAKAMPTNCSGAGRSPLREADEQRDDDLQRHDRRHDAHRPDREALIQRAEPDRRTVRRARRRRGASHRARAPEIRMISREHDEPGRLRERPRPGRRGAGSSARRGSRPCPRTRPRTVRAEGTRMPQTTRTPSFQTCSMRSRSVSNANGSPSTTTTSAILPGLERAEPVLPAHQLGRRQRAGVQRLLGREPVVRHVRSSLRFQPCGITAASVPSATLTPASAASSHRVELRAAQPLELLADLGRELLVVGKLLGGVAGGQRRHQPGAGARPSSPRPPGRGTCRARSSARRRARRA